MKDVGSGIGIKNISDLVLKEIHGICETKNPLKEQVNEYKMTKKQIYKKFTNLSQEKLNTINNKKTLEEYSVKIYKIDSYFYKHYEKKYKLIKNGIKYILFKIDVYFNKFFLAVGIDEKGYTDRDLIFEEKRQKALEKNFVVNLLELIQVMEKMVMI